MRVPPPEHIRMQVAFQRGDHLTLLAEGDAIARSLDQRGDTRDFARHIRCMIGSLHMAGERFQLAATYLEQALPDPADRPVPPPPGPPVSATTVPTADVAATMVGASTSAPPGAPADPSRRSVRPAEIDFDPFELVLLDAYLLLGRYDDALTRITPLLEPMRSLNTRFSATRAQATIAGIRGDYETAHFLHNTASGLALRLKSRFRAALVDGDRALTFAAQGRLYEGINAADRVIPLFVRPAVGQYQVWGNAIAASVALTLARMAANADDLLAAQRLLIQASTAVERADRDYLRGHLALSEGAFAGAERQNERAEASLAEAQRVFAMLGTAPASALTLLEQARLARSRGLHLSAMPVCESAIREFHALGQPRELNEARQMLMSLQRATAAH